MQHSIIEVTEEMMGAIKKKMKNGIMTNITKL